MWPQHGRSGDLVPKAAQAMHAVRRRVAGNDRRIDRADRDTRDPIRRIVRGGQCLVDAGLVAAKRAPCRTKPTFLSYDAGRAGGEPSVMSASPQGADSCSL